MYFDGIRMTYDSINNTMIKSDKISINLDARILASEVIRNF